MSIVYEGYQDGLDRRVAVKALDTGGALPKDLAERFRREGRAYAQLSHAAIVAVHDLVEKDEALYLITEFVDGPDLRRVLAGGAISPACVAALGARLADALECVHAHSLVHRDVKPANVMITRRGEVKLMDLGVAKRSHRHQSDPHRRRGRDAGLRRTRGAGGRGSRRGERPVGARGDALRARDRRAPFFGDSFPALFTAVRKKPFRPIREVVPGFPRRLARAIERCLEKRPAQRWDSRRSPGAGARRLRGGPARRGAPGGGAGGAGRRARRRRGEEDGAAPEAEVIYGALAHRRRRALGPRRLTWALLTALAAMGAWYVLAGRF